MMRPQIWVYAHNKAMHIDCCGLHPLILSGCSGRIICTTKVDGVPFPLIQPLKVFVIDKGHLALRYGMVLVMLGSVPSAGARLVVQALHPEQATAGLGF